MSDHKIAHPKKCSIWIRKLNIERILNWCHHENNGFIFTQKYWLFFLIFYVLMLHPTLSMRLLKSVFYDENIHVDDSRTCSAQITRDFWSSNIGVGQRYPKSKFPMSFWYVLRLVINKMKPFTICRVCRHSCICI